MASSILRLTSPISIAAAESCLRRIPIPPNSVCSTSRSARTAGRGSLSALGRVALRPPSFEEGGDTSHGNMYSLFQGKVVSLNNPKQETESSNPLMVVGSSHGWLALFNERDCNLFLWNPTTRQSIELPPLETFKENLSVSKVTVSCAPDQGECLAVMASCTGRKLACCRPGRSTTWTPIGGLRDTDQGRLYPDFVYSSKHKLFFCLAEFDDMEGFDMEIWDLHNESAIRSFVGIKPNKHESQKHEIPREQLRRYLVYAEHSDQLFLVTRLLANNTYKTVGFHVHSFGFYDDKFGPQFINPGAGMERKKLRYMKESLDGLVMFVGINDSFAVPAAEFPELKPNSIYFSGGDDDIGIFDYQNRILSPCYYSSDVQRVDHTAAPFWFTIQKLVYADDFNEYQLLDKLASWIFFHLYGFINSIIFKSYD